MTVRDLLNRLRWDPGAAQAGVTIVLRVREEGRATTQELPFDDVREILPAAAVSEPIVRLPRGRTAEA